MGNQGKGLFSRIFLGSVSDAVAREAKQPVWILKGREQKFRRILVPLDGSKGSLEALEMACRLVGATGAYLHPVSIVEEVFEDKEQKNSRL
jgi:nucleotide-binding universal stress UspA family protein